MKPMRCFVMVLGLLVADAALADKKLADTAARFSRELAACEMQEGGLATVLAKTRTLVTTNPPDKPELDKDIERLAQGHALVEAYCTDVRAMVAFLDEHAEAAYKTVQKELAARDAAVRKTRREGKQAIEELAPLTRKLIPKVNARTREIEDKKLSGKFPSGRVVDLPPLPGAWKLAGNPVTDIAEYTAEGVTGSVTAYPFANATCDQQRRMFVMKAGDEPIVDLELSPAAKAIDVQWAWRYVRRDQTPHLLTMMCVPAGAGGFVAIADLAPVDQPAIADELTKLMVAMLAAQIPKR